MDERLTEWVPSVCEEGGILARESFCVAKYGSSIYLFGGKKSQNVFCDFYEIQIKASALGTFSARYSIKRVFKANDEATWPTPRYGAACCVFNNKICIHGGRSGNIIYNVRL